MACRFRTAGGADQACVVRDGGVDDATTDATTEMTDRAPRKATDLLSLVKPLFPPIVSHRRCCSARCTETTNSVVGAHIVSTRGRVNRCRRFLGHRRQHIRRAIRGRLWRYGAGVFRCRRREAGDRRHARHDLRRAAAGTVRHWPCVSVHLLPDAALAAPFSPMRHQPTATMAGLRRADPCAKRYLSGLVHPTRA